MLLWVMGVGFENTCTVSVKWSVSRVIPRLHGWVYKLLRLSNCYFNCGFPISAGSQLGGPQFKSYGYLEFDATLEIGVGFENTCTASGKWNENTGLVQDFIFWFCVWWKSRELGGRESRRFPCVTLVIESFSSDLLRATISYWKELHLESCQTSTMELFWKYGQRTKDVDYFCKEAPPQMFNWIPNTSLSDWKGAVNAGWR